MYAKIVTTTIGYLRGRKNRGRKKPPRGAKKWIIGGGAVLLVSLSVFLAVFVVIASGASLVSTAATAPLRVVTSTACSVRAVIPGAGECDDDEASDEVDELNELREELEKASGTDAMVLACVADIPPVTAVNQPLYVGEPPAEVTTVVAGPDGKPVEVTQPAKNADLVSDGEPVVPPGSQVITEDHRPTEAAERVMSTLPEGTHPVIARAYLVTALAGGTTGYDHFERVAARALDGKKISADNAVAVAQAFFPVGTDLRPYYRVADAYILTAVQAGVIDNDNGSADFIYDAAQDCGDAAAAAGVNG